MNKKELEYNLKRIEHLAKQYAETKKCPKCGEKKWKVVFLREFGDPEMPSQVVINCMACKVYNEVFAKAPDEMARAYAEEEMRLKNAGIKKAKPGDLDKLILTK